MTVEIENIMMSGEDKMSSNLQHLIKIAIILYEVITFHEHINEHHQMKREERKKKQQFELIKEQRR